MMKMYIVICLQKLGCPLDDKDNQEVILHTLQKV